VVIGRLSWLLAPLDAAGLPYNLCIREEIWVILRTLLLQAAAKVSEAACDVTNIVVDLDNADNNDCHDSNYYIGPRVYAV
jgi:hypothetical protein